MITTHGTLRVLRDYPDQGASFKTIAQAIDALYHGVLPLVPLTLKAQAALHQQLALAPLEWNLIDPDQPSEDELLPDDRLENDATSAKRWFDLLQNFILGPAGWHLVGRIWYQEEPQLVVFLQYFGLTQV